MFSIKQPKDQDIRQLSVDVIPYIDVKADKKTLCSTLETINSILRHGKSHQKLECVETIMLAVYIKDTKQSRNFDKALEKTKVFETMLELMKFKDYNDLLFKDDETRNLNIGIVSCTMNVTNFLKGVGVAIAEAGGISFLTDICRFKPFLDKLENEHIYSFIVSVVATLHNIARLTSVPQYFSDSKTAEAMVPFFDCTDERLKIYAFIGAAQTCNDSEIHMLVDTKGVISSILKYLQKATGSCNYSYGGAELKELLEGIEKLASADPNKKKILEAGALPIFQTILDLDKPEEQALTARVLWTMTFDDDVAKEVKSSKALLDKLQILSKSSDKAVRSNVKGLLYNLDHRSKKKAQEDQFFAKQKPSTFKAAKQQDKHLFISYSWKEKEIVLKLKDLLQEKGLLIWIDTEQMRGSTLQAMAEAVENAALVLICMSESYKHSPNCRLESEYTYRCGKEFIPLMVQKYYKPDGWLGALLGTKLFIDFSGKYQFEPKWNELIKELQAHKMLGKEEAIQKTTIVAAPIQATSSTKLNVSTIDDVKQWLISNKLEKCCHHFEDVNGEGLLQLKYMRHDAPECYFKMLSRKLKLSVGETLNFTAALEKL
ncbi:uncharacterized protein LOC127721827 isoform X2 [Mytilus californianus]|uniref:uncharacterized protein LOC127721827 isoform X2 n=1 Tax=Mytilus californianus TaxID=6549 RepID=UPI002246F6E0|nr:uncharacterized protein LOC127721827 isoform X2 [Mytilus californianus]